jgi:hypothetical protein
MVQRSRTTTILDWLAFALIVAAVAIALTGGLSFRIGGDRITARSADRALLAAVAVLAVRFALDRRTRLLADAPQLWRKIRPWLVRSDRDPEPDTVPVSWRIRGLAGLGYGLFAVVLLFPQLQRLDSVPDLGDPLFSIWRTGWVFHKLGGDPRPLFSPGIFYPHELTLTYSDSMLLPALTTAPLLAAGVHPVTAYNLILVLSFVASAWAMYLLAERLTGFAPGAFVAGLLFGFHPYRFEHYSHFELQMTYCMPLALLSLHRFVRSGGWRHALFFAVLTAGQLYSSMYYAVFFTIFVAALFGAMSLLTRPPFRRMVGPAILAGALALLLAWPLARTYSAAKLGDRDASTVAYYSATTGDYFRAHPRSATWGEVTFFPGRMPERALFPGAMMLLLAAIALIPPVGRTRAAYALVLVVMFEVSRGFNSAFYPYLYEWLGFVRGLRVPARASILVGLVLSLLAGFAVRRLLVGRSPILVTGAVAAVIVAIGIDLRPDLRLEPVWRVPPPIYGAVAGNPNVVLAEFPLGGSHRGFTANVPFMYFSLWHWTAMVNGYSGHYPPGQVDFEVALEAFPDATTIELLRKRGTTHVTINCALIGTRCERLLDSVDANPAFRIVSSARWQDAPVRLYEMVK